MEDATDAIWGLRADLLRTALRATGNQHDAEDLVQETFVKAFAHLDQFTPGTNLRAWLFVIMRNTNQDRYRATSRRPQLSEQRRDRWELPSAQNVENDALHGALDPRITGALAALSADHRTVLVLAYIKGMSFQEISEEVGVGVGTVKTRLFRGRVALRKALQSGQPDDEWNERSYHAQQDG